MKIAIFSELEWAFGRIAKNVQRHSRYEIDVVDWSRYHDQQTFTLCDLVYVPEPDTKPVFCSMYPGVDPRRVVFGAHSLVHFVSNDFGSPMRHRTVTAAEVTEKLQLTPQAVEWLNRNATVIGCVSEELMTVLGRQGRFTPVLTSCGVEDSCVDESLIAPPRRREGQRLRIVFPYRRDFTGGHRYDAKRSYLIRELEDSIKPFADMIYLPHQMSLKDLDAWYRQVDGDFVVCLSHSEGNPFSIIEGSGRGLAILSTRVGVAPEIVRDGETGILLSAHDPADIIDEATRKLRALSHTTVAEMKRAALTESDARWRWSKKVPLWDAFFKRTHLALGI